MSLASSANRQLKSTPSTLPPLRFTQPCLDTYHIDVGRLQHLLSHTMLHLTVARHEGGDGRHSTDTPPDPGGKYELEVNITCFWIHHTQTVSKHSHLRTGLMFLHSHLRSSSPLFNLSILPVFLCSCTTSCPIPTLG